MAKIITRKEGKQSREAFVEGLRTAGWTRKAATEAWKRVVGEVPTPPSNESTLLDYRGAAALVGVSEMTLRHWVSSGVHAIPHIKYGRGGGRVRFRRTSLLAWVASRERFGARCAPENAGVAPGLEEVAS